MKTQMDRNVQIIKGTAYNKIQRYFQTSKKYNKVTNKFEPIDPLGHISDEEKFKAIEEVMKEAVSLMRNYKRQKSNKKKVNAERAKRGYTKKKKVSKAQYEEYLSEKACPHA